MPEAMKWTESEIELLKETLKGPNLVTLDELENVVLGRSRNAIKVKVVRLKLTKFFTQHDKATKRKKSYYEALAQAYETLDGGEFSELCQSYNVSEKCFKERILSRYHKTRKNQKLSVRYTLVDLLCFLKLIQIANAKKFKELFDWQCSKLIQFLKGHAWYYGMHSHHWLQNRSRTRTRFLAWYDLEPFLKAQNILVPPDIQRLIVSLAAFQTYLERITQNLTFDESYLNFKNKYSSLRG